MKSEIRAVTVYSRGARVTRVAKLGPWSGEPPTRIALSGLPLAADDGSLHVRVDADNPNRPAPTAVDVRVSLDVPTSGDDLPPAEDSELESVRIEEARIHERISQVQRELTRLDRLNMVPRPKPLDGSAPGDSPFEGRLELIDFRSERASKLVGEMRELKRELREVQRRRAQLEDKNNRRSTARSAREHELRKTAIVRLDHGEGDGEGELVVDYLVPGARWAPAYSVSVDPRRSTSRVNMRGVVAQRTGEDWTGVELTLSTADAQSFEQLPELSSLRIGPFKPAAKQIGWRPPPAGTGDLYNAYDAAFEADFLGAPERKALIGDEFDDDETDFVEDHLETTPYMEAVTKEHDVSAYDRMLTEDETSEQENTAVVPRRAAKREAPKGKAREERAARPTQPMFQEQALGGAPPPAASAAPAPPPGGIPAAQAEAVTEAFGEISREIEIERPLVAAPDMLDYGRLFMPPARDRRRGYLQHQDTRERYLELLEERGLEVDFDVVQVVAEAAYRARDIEFSDPPPGCSFAWSERFDYSYRAAAAADVASDGTFHSVPVQDGEGQSKLRYLCVPRVASDVFRSATISNPFVAPLLPGPADVYLGTDFVVTSEIPMTPRGAEMELGLGVEQRVKVARNTRYGEDSAGLLGGSRSLRHEILIEVENHLDFEIELDVRERLPTVSEDEEDIKVEVGKVSPPWSPWEPALEDAGDERLRGGHHWVLVVDSRDKREMRVHYEIKISSKNELVGGNRRE